MVQATKESAIHPLRIDGYLSSYTCLRWRLRYEQGLNEHRFVPNGNADRTDIALESVIGRDAVDDLYLDVVEIMTKHFALPPIRLDYCAYTRLRSGGCHPLHADAVLLDGGPNHTPDRVATAMVYLTEEGQDFSGGMFQFP